MTEKPGDGDAVGGNESEYISAKGALTEPATVKR